MDVAENKVGDDDNRRVGIANLTSKFSCISDL
jgi:hypothetical protein